MEPLPLFDKDKSRTGRDTDNSGDQSDDESNQAVDDDEQHDGAHDGCCRPVDISALESHKLQGLLQPLQEWVIWVTVVLLFCCHSFHLKVSKQQVSCLETEEHRQCLSSSNEEKAGTNDHHDLLLQNLLPNCKVLNINTPKKQKVPKETNWKQKFQKPQNENICLTYLNMEMNGNFHFLSFCAAFLKVQNQVL